MVDTVWHLVLERRPLDRERYVGVLAELLDALRARSAHRSPDRAGCVEATSAVELWCRKDCADTWPGNAPPIALLRLVDGQWQWFESRAGLDEAETTDKSSQLFM